MSDDRAAAGRYLDEWYKQRLEDSLARLVHASGRLADVYKAGTPADVVLAEHEQTVEARVHAVTEAVHRLEVVRSIGTAIGEIVGPDSEAH